MAFALIYQEETNGGEVSRYMIMFSGLIEGIAGVMFVYNILPSVTSASVTMGKTSVKFVMASLHRRVSREDAYRIVQRNAMKVWEEIQQGKSTTNEEGESLYLQYLLADDELRESLSEKQISALGNMRRMAENTSVLLEMLKFVWAVEFVQQCYRLGSYHQQPCLL